MSTTIDNRVVEMQFNNQQFERNVQTSMSTLEKLKQSLNLTGAAKGFENVDNASKKISFAGLGNAVEAVHSKFSALEVMGITALANITNSAVNAGKRIANALTIKPITTGFSEYETQINAVQTILANTESKGTTLKDVNGALDTLNEYADKTIYNFTEMTRNIGTFTAAGVDLDTSVKSIQGIANLAAVSGSTSQQASTAMYQLSQALAAGKVSLMDWNSVVNAGMGGQVFQDALKRTAKAMGTDVDAIIQKYGSFRESLTQGEWLTTDVLTKTLEQFTMSAKEGSKEWDAFKKSLMEDGYTEKQAEEILKMANTATNAATKVKTFTQLWDTLQEAAQSGWTQTWEIIVGDFEEAKELLTKVSDVIGDMINKSAKARNDLLQGWKDAGGRTDFIEGVWNVFDGILNIVTPIKEAFREIFPPMTVDQLVNFTKGFKNLTESFKEFTSAHGDNIKKAFKGIFAVLDIGWTLLKDLGSGIIDIIKNFKGLGGGILGAAGSLGDWLLNLRDTVKETNVFKKGITKVVDIISNGIKKIKGFGETLKESLSAHKFEGFVNFFKGFWGIVQKIGSGIGKVLGPVWETLAGMFNNANLFDVLNSFLLTGSFLGIGKMAGGFEAIKGLVEDLIGEGGAISNIKEMFSGILDTFTSYQNNLNAGTLQKIATAIGILAASMFVLSLIDTDKMYSSLTAVSVLLGELMASIKLFDSMGTGLKGAGKAAIFMVGMSAAILLLTGALKNASSLSWEEIAKGVLAIGGAMAVLVAALKFLPRNTSESFKGLFKSFKSGTSTNFISAGIGMIAMAAAMKILVSVIKDFSEMSLEDIGKGLLGLAGALGAIVLAMKLMPKNSLGNVSGGMVSMGIGMIALATAMKILVSAVSDFGSMDWEQLIKGVGGMAVALMAITAAVSLMPKNMVGIGVGLIAVSTAMLILANAIQNMGGMSWEEIGRGMTVLGGSMAILALGLNLMSGTLLGSAALLTATIALGLLVPVMFALGSMSWETIGKGLLTLAGAFAVMGIAGLLLGPIVPTILALSAAMALFGVGVAAIGVGVIALSAGFTALVTAISAGAAAFVAGLTVVITGIATLIPIVATEFAKAIITFCQVIGEGAPKILEAFTKIIVALVEALVEATPVIIDGFLTLVTSILEALAKHTPTIVAAASDFMVAFIEGITDNLPRLVQAAFDLIINFIDSLAVAIEQNAPKLANAMRNLIVSLVKAAVSILTGAVKTFKEAGSAIINSGLVKGILSKITAFGKCVGTLILKGLMAINNLKNKFLEAGKNLITKVVTGVTNAASSVKNACTKVISSAKDAVTNKIKDFTNIGKNIIEGLKNGIANAAQGVVNAAKNVVGNAVDAAKKLLGIKSPSRVFAGIGKYMDEGLIMGLKSMSGDVVKATTQMGKGAIGAMNKAVSNIDSIASDMMNGIGQPTIRPIVDLSDVKSGAKSINGMLDMSPTVGVMSNIKSISSMMGQRNQNGTNADIISELSKLRGDLQNAGGNTYQINGITYDDGSAVSNAVATLIRATTMQGRV